MIKTDLAAAICGEGTLDAGDWTACASTRAPHASAQIAASPTKRISFSIVPSPCKVGFSGSGRWFLIYMKFLGCAIVADSFIGSVVKSEKAGASLTALRGQPEVSGTHAYCSRV